MGALYAKLKNESAVQRSWRFICLKKSPQSESSTVEFLPYFRDIYISGRGLDKISIIPSLSWPDKYQLEIPVHQLYQYQNRFRVDRLHVHNLASPTLNELFAAYSHCYNAQLTEVHLFQCETEKTDESRFHSFLKAQHMKSTIQEFTDNNNCIKMAKIRTLGSEGYITTHFYVRSDLVFEHKVKKRKKMAQATFPPTTEALTQDLWKTIKKGQLPPRRFECQQLNLEIKGKKVRITPNFQWDKESQLTTNPEKLSLYLQYVDCYRVSVTSSQINDNSRKTLLEIIRNLALSQCLHGVRQFAFQKCDFLFVDQEIFRQFLIPRKAYMEPIVFDPNCCNLLQVQMALEAVYREKNGEKRHSYASEKRHSYASDKRHSYASDKRLSYASNLYSDI